MKAVIWTDYGPPEVLKYRDVEKPEPKENEVLIKVAATTVTAGDCEMRSLKLPLLFRIPIRIFAGIRKPSRLTILGQEFSGVVESVGNQVKKYQAGDQVFGTTSFHLGAYAEYICLPESSNDGILAKTPPTLPLDTAAAVPFGSLEALYFTRKAGIQKGQKVLINGGGGSIGTYAVQLAKYFGGIITAVDRFEKLDMLKSIGADQVIDYQKEDFTQNGQTYDVILDIIGKSSYFRSLRSLSDTGSYVIANPIFSHMLLKNWTHLTSKKQVVVENSQIKADDLEFIKNLIDKEIIKPVIDRTYTLEQMAEAHRYVESGKKKGNLLISIS